jgi:hypothetical protein
MREDDIRGEVIGVRYTSKSLSGYGGLIALMRVWERVGVRKLLEATLPDGRTSPNQRTVYEIAQSLIAGVLTGASRFAHVQRIAHDGVMRAILRIQRVASPMTLTRYFGGMRRSQVAFMSEQFDRFCLRFVDPSVEDVLDLDSTVLQRHGFQEGSRRGYSPKRRGRTTQHPLVAMLTKQRFIAHFWLRSGDASPLRGAVEFLDEVMVRIAGMRIKGLRTDSGFSSNAFLERAEHHRLKYACAISMHRPLQRFIARISNWSSTEEEGVEIAEALYHPPHWKSERRLIVVRKKVTKRRPEGKVLFEIPGYTFLAVVTNLTSATTDVWKFYNGRGEAENLLKELKYDYGFDGFCLQSFDGTEAVLRLIVLSFNMVQVFRLAASRKKHEQLKTLRTRIFIGGAALGKEGEKAVLRLSIAGKLRRNFRLLLDKIATVTQVGQVIFSEPFTPESNPSPMWRARRDPRLRPLILGN